jgi:hypothetical protein
VPGRNASPKVFTQFLKGLLPLNMSGFWDFHTKTGSLYCYSLSGSLITVLYQFFNFANKFDHIKIFVTYKTKPGKQKIIEYLYLSITLVA